MSEANFDRIAEVYEESLPAHVVEHYLRKRVALLSEICPAGDALDVGCGTGTLAARLSDAGLRMSGIDPSAGMLEVLGRQAPQIEARQAPGERIPFDDEAFDLTYSVATFHHIAEPGAISETLAEMTRVTRPGGRIVVWDHNPRNPYWRILMARVPQDDGSERLIPETEIRSGLERSGCQEIDSRPLGFIPDFVPERALGLARGIERVIEGTPGLRSLCAHNVIVATRPS